MASPDLEIGNHKLINTKFIGENEVRHTTFRSDPSLGTHRVKVVETWYRGREIGHGSSGTVYLEKSGKGKHRAVKRIAKDKNSSIRIDYKRELTAMAMLSKHDNLFVQLFGWYENANYVYIAMEYISHGDLRNYLEKERTEHEAKVVTRQMLEGLVVIHQEGFAHRDLKPENIFVVSKTPIRIKIGDFGLAKLARNGTAFRTEGGTKDYIAPEAAGADHDRETSEYTNAVDIWALGCITHEMLTREPPFRGWRALNLYCSRPQPEFPRDTMLSKNISENGIEFVARTLAYPPERRIAAKEALDSQWLRLEDEGVAGLEIAGNSTGLAVPKGAALSGAMVVSKESPPGILKATNSSPLAIAAPKPQTPGGAHLNNQKGPPSEPRFASPPEITSDLWSDDVIDTNLFPRTNSPDAIFGPKKRSTGSAVGLDTAGQSGVGAPWEEAHFGGHPGDGKVRFRDRVAMISDQPPNGSEARVELPLLDDKLELLDGVASAHANGLMGRRAEEGIANRGQNPFRKPKPVINIAPGVREVLKGVLIEIHASTDSPQRPMLKDDDAVQMLIDGRIRTDVRDSAGNTPLHIVASRQSQNTPAGDVPALTVDALVASGSAIDRKNSQGRTPLLSAVDYGREHVVEKLLELGANIEEPDYGGTRPLMMAVLRDNQPLVQLLLEHGAYTGTVKVKERDVTPLHWAAETGSHSIVRAILGTGADINAQDGATKQTPLHKAINKEHTAVADTLLQEGANVEARDVTERTALHHAVAKRSVPLVKLLLDNGANPDVEDKWYDSPRREADRANVHGMVDAFAEADVKRAQRVGRRNPLDFAPEYPGEEEYLYETDED